MSFEKKIGRLIYLPPRFRKEIIADKKHEATWHCRQTEVMTRQHFEDRELGACLGMCTHMEKEG